MKKILVAIDFTPASRNAAEYAAALAKSFQAGLYLLHVFLEPAPANEIPARWMLAESELQKENDARMQKEVSYLKEKYGVAVSGSTQVGFTAETINSEAKEQHSDLIVMGMQREAGSRIFGSNVITTVRKAKTPVLVVPQGASFTPPTHIVLTSDFREVQAASCWTLLYKLVETFDAALQVLHVQPTGSSGNEIEVPGKEQLQQILSKCSYQYQRINDADVTHGVFNFIESHPTDLLVMVAHRHNLLERTFGNIHTRTMSYETKLPLLILEDK
jgi:nucleotide-binding universal stress UspA family protein